MTHEEMVWAVLIYDGIDKQFAPYLLEVAVQAVLKQVEPAQIEKVYRERFGEEQPSTSSM